jgi:hypothetical protein
MACSDDNPDRSRTPVADERRCSSTVRILGGRTIERSDDVVCILHRAQEDDERKFLG